MNTDTIVECMKLSFADTPFPNVVARLIDAGVKSYNADLIKLRNTYYGTHAEVYDEALPLTKKSAVATTFDAPALAASISAIQKGELGYAAFLHRIMASGCSHYEVFIAGRKVIYFGRDGDFHTEHFPAGK